MSEPLRDEAGTVTTEPDPVEVTEPQPGLPPPTAVESLVNALLEAGPEVAEHVVASARELLLASQTLVEAAERAVQEQQDIRAQARDDVLDADGDGEPAAVRHLDVAE